MAAKRTLVPLGLLAVLLTGSARGADPSFGSAAIATPPGVSAAAVADVNNDGASDLAVVNWALNEVTILLGDGAGRFKAGSSVKGASDLARSLRRTSTATVRSISRSRTTRTCRFCSG